MERKPEIKAVSLRTETAYKADGPGKAAPHADTVEMLHCLEADDHLRLILAALKE